MKLIKVTLGLLAALSISLASEGALAYGHGGGHGGWHGGGGYGRGGNVGVYFGGPLFWPGYYGAYPYAPYYGSYYGPGYYPPAQPTTYVEQDQAQAAPEQAAPAASWYYCAESKTYYPYVKQCPGGWQQVAPQPGPPQ
jgi:hypothetical protein